MFRLAQFIKELYNPTPIAAHRDLKGPVVIWNLIRRCNLTCKHCYAISADKDFPGELTTTQINTTMDDLKSANVPVLILSGGEPLLHPDIYDISKRAKKMGFYVGLSTNGTLIDGENIDKIAECDYNYVGISIDGMQKTHDYFRRKKGAFDLSMKAVKLCKQRNLKIGLRFTITQDNAKELPELLKLADDEAIDKFYLSHLNYAGRGNHNRMVDTLHKMTRDAMDLMFETALKEQKNGVFREYVTGNNDADGAYFLKWVMRNFPDKEDHIKAKLIQWGGNSSGVNVANIDNLGEVHPDTMWWHYNLGNVKDRPFSQIWRDMSDPLMDGLSKRPRAVTGRCGKCQYIPICNGNTRVRAHQLTGDFWAEDPACYLNDDEIGISTDDNTANADRLQVMPFSRKRRA